MRGVPPVHPEFMLEPVFDPLGAGRDAIGLGHTRKAGLDTRHGTVLSLEDISVSFDGFKALNALNLYIGVGELRCIIGPNGAGKTTLMDVITGKTRPDSGTAYFGDTLDLTRLSEYQIAQAGIGRKFQKPTVFEALTVYENLELVVEHDMGFVGSIADHVTVLHQGSVLAEGSLEQVQADERVVEVYLGR